MTDRDFAAALATALLPGGALANGVTAPPAGSLLSPEALTAWLQAPENAPAHAAVQALCGDTPFADLDPETQTSLLQQAEAQAPDAFAALVLHLSQLYYQHPDVVRAFGWRTAPPQPLGHSLEETDTGLFATVAERGPIWRKDR